MANYVLTPNIGDPRGDYAIDFNFGRTASDMVASGYASVLIGGSDNKATGNYSSVLGGFNNTVTGEASLVIGAYNECNGNNSFVFGYSNKSDAFTSYVGGKYNQVQGSYHFIFGQYGNLVNDLTAFSTVLNCQTFYVGTDSSDGGAQAPKAAIFSGGFAWPVHDGEQVRNSRFYEAVVPGLKAVQSSVITMFYEGPSTPLAPAQLQTDGDMMFIPNLGKDLTMLHNFNAITGAAVPIGWSLTVNWTAIDLINNRVITGEDLVLVNRVNTYGIAIASVFSNTIAKAGDGLLNSSSTAYAISAAYPNSITIKLTPSYASNYRVVARVHMLQDMFIPQ